TTRSSRRFTISSIPARFCPHDCWSSSRTIPILKRSRPFTAPPGFALFSFATGEPTAGREADETAGPNMLRPGLYGRCYVRCGRRAPSSPLRPCPAKTPDHVHRPPLDLLEDVADVKTDDAQDHAATRHTE